MCSKPLTQQQTKTLSSGRPQATASASRRVNEARAVTTRLPATANRPAPPILHDDDEDDEDDAFEVAANVPIRKASHPTRPAIGPIVQANVQTEEQVSGTRSVGSTLAKMLKPAISRKEVPSPTQKRFIDRQDTAEKVHFSQASQPRFRLPGQSVEAPDSPSRSSATSLGKRTRQEPVDIDEVMDNPQTEEEPSQDGGFQGDTHSNGVAQRHASVPNSSRSLPRTSQPAAAVTSPPKRPRQNPGQSIDYVAAEALTGRDAANATSGQRARMITTQNKIDNRVAPSRMQTRTPWSEEEETRLIDMIADHGCKWAVIKDNDKNSLDMFSIRDQVGIRDKARNLRVQFEL